jgi:uncharacterized membrane protein
MVEINKILMIILFLILISSNTYAINLGSVEKNSFAEIFNGESAKFTILFWNSESESYGVKLLVKDSPKDWVVIINPDEFMLNKSIGEEYINLPYNNENVKAKVVNIFVKPDSSSKPGKYSVTIKAETDLNQNESNEISVIPERLFTFEINLKGFTTTNDRVESREKIPTNKIEAGNDSLESYYLKADDKTDKKYFYLAIVSLVIIVSIIIYKKY